MKKVLYVATVVKTHIMEFHIPYLKMLKEMGYQTAVAARNDFEIEEDCIIPYCDNYFNVPFERFPIKKENVKAYKMLKQIIDTGEYDIVHCHTPVGAMVTRLAACSARKKGCKVVYTAHGFHFFKGAPLLNWLVYYPIEKTFARLTDVLITINQEDFQRAKTFKAKKVCYVPGVGLDVTRFIDTKKNADAKRRELGLCENNFVLLSVGELIERKNHKVVLEAIAKLKGTEEFERIRYVICGRGVLAESLKHKANELGIEDKVLFLGYRHDISEICNSSDVFVFMSYQEGLPVALMEAMACGLPVICSKIRGNTDLVENDVTGCIVENTSDAVAEAIKKYMNSKEYYELIRHNMKTALDDFELSHVQNLVKQIYLDVDD